MRLSTLLVWAITALTVTSAQSVQGIQDLVKRRLPHHVDSFSFSLVNATQPYDQTNDQYIVSSASNGTILVEGNSLSALASGLHRYLTDVAHVDIYWFIGSRLHLAPPRLPLLSAPLKGASIVPWRYHFNTVTFSYTSAFWTWEEWEAQLDWMALRGVNLPLAWVGQEKILVEVFREIGLTDDEILTYLSGPAFQAWNRFGNIQGSWGGDLPFSWIDAQFDLQKRIIKRMVELGMTPVLPSFTGFVPRNIKRIFPDAMVVNGSRWNDFSTTYTNVTFLEPTDSRFAQLQKSFISKQTAAYGNVSNIYTLDQYNENDPYSGNPDYLRNITHNTWKSLKDADPAAIWLMQGWLFYSNSDFWTDTRVEAFLSGIEEDQDMLILDLFSESAPQWQRTKSYYGKPWIWCQLHGYGGNMGLYGQVENITVNPIEALSNSSSLVGFGLTMEGQEGNEIVYDLLLDQAWSKTPIDTKIYFHDWVSSRYAGSKSIPEEIYTAWDILRTTVYNNTNLTAATAVTKSIFELSPNISGLVNRTSHHPTTINYPQSALIQSWNKLYDATEAEPSLWDNQAFLYDMVDVTRQALANAFVPLYTDLVSTYLTGTNSTDDHTLVAKGHKLTSLLSALDSVLSTNKHFSLSTWLSSARSSASSAAAPNSSTTANFFSYDARNQVTLWGPNGEISDYASKSWGGLVSSYYIPRWFIFVDYLKSTSVAAYNTTALNEQLVDFSLKWQTEELKTDGVKGHLRDVLDRVRAEWEDVFMA